MSQLDRQSPIIRRLIGRAERGERGKRVDQIALCQLEAVEAAARQKEQLVVAHVACGTQFAFEAVALTQQAALRVTRPPAMRGLFDLS